ncbi:MAG: hypothetical protein RJB60_466 [Pseudomonadota bacterium]|jgi:hypothetical protein
MTAMTTFHGGIVAARGQRDGLRFRRSQNRQLMRGGRA